MNLLMVLVHGPIRIRQTTNDYTRAVHKIHENGDKFAVL